MKHINEYFNTLYNLERTGIKYSLKNITDLLFKIGNPHLETKFIHIAGTNGKGGTSSFLASIMMEHGLKTGLYTSPHLLKFNERIQINGNFITNSYIKKFIDYNLNYIKKIKASFFEVTTALAFKYFADKKVDLAIIETGLGGRLDSTNVVKAELCIITQIGIDHTQYLGNDIKSIALEKLGIVKNGDTVILSDNNKILKPIFNRRLKNNTVFYLDNYTKIHSIKEQKGYTSFSADFKLEKNDLCDIKFFIPLAGLHHIRNACTAILAANMYLNSIKKVFSLVKTKSGLHNIKNNTFYRGRSEIIKHKHFNYIFDVSHNPDGIKSTIDCVKSFDIKAVVFGIMKDKDYKTALNHLNELNSPIIFTMPLYKRSRNPGDLYKYYRSILKAKNENILIEKDVEKALFEAKNFSNKDGYILILGSFFLISEAIRKLKLMKYFYSK